MIPIYLEPRAPTRKDKGSQQVTKQEEIQQFQLLSQGEFLRMNKMKRPRTIEMVSKRLELNLMTVKRSLATIRSPKDPEPPRKFLPSTKSTMRNQTIREEF